MNEAGEVLGVGLVQVLMLVGLIGLFLPIFPGLVVMWLAALVYGLAVGFNTLGIVLFVIITILVISGSVVDNVFMGAGARQGGASWASIGVAMVAGLVGTIVFPPFGGFIAAPLAVLVLEYVRLKDMKLALAALRGMAAGWGLSFVARFLIGLLIMGLWWLWVWQR